MGNAVIVPNPDNEPREVTTGYQRQNENLAMGNAGYANIYLRDNSMAAGSVFELNGNLVKVMENTPVAGVDDIPSPGIERFVYVVASPDETEGSVSFYLIEGNGPPIWYRGVDSPVGAFQGRMVREGHQ